jgi:hypothetical protein
MLRDGIGYEEFTRRGEVGLCEGSGELGRKAAVSGGEDGTASHFRVVGNEPIRFHVAGTALARIDDGIRH